MKSCWFASAARRRHGSGWVCWRPQALGHRMTFSAARQSLAFRLSDSSLHRTVNLARRIAALTTCETGHHPAHRARYVCPGQSSPPINRCHSSLGAIPPASNPPPKSVGHSIAGAKEDRATKSPCRFSEDHMSSPSLHDALVLFPRRRAAFAASEEGQGHRSRAGIDFFERVQGWEQ